MNKSNWRLFTMLFLATFVSLAACQVSSSEPTNTLTKSGLQVILEADLAKGQELPAGSLDTVREIIERRLKELDVAEALVQTQGTHRIIIELPGIDDPDLVIHTIKQTGLLELVDTGVLSLPPDMEVQTTYRQSNQMPGETVTITLPVYETVFSNRDLKSVSVIHNNQVDQYQIAFEMQPEAAERFAQYTSSHIDQMLAIVLDGRVISSPRITNAIPDGKGVISGNFSHSSARSLAVQLQHGALPFPLKVVQMQTIP